MPKLREWSVVNSQSGYAAALRGVVQDHLLHDDGKVVITSRIIAAHGRTVSTRSGTVYELDGPPSIEYLKWLDEHGYKYNAEQPIKVIDEVNCN